MLDDCNGGAFVVSQVKAVPGKCLRQGDTREKKHPQEKKEKRLKRLFIPGAQTVRSEDIQLSLLQPQEGGRNAGVVVGCSAS